MSRQYDDPIQVRRGASADAPQAFLWRGRLYVVRAVLLSWIEAVPWWRGESTAALLSGADSDGEAVTGTLTALPGSCEREMWRVEASRGRAFATGVFELAFDATTGSWSLARALD